MYTSPKVRVSRWLSIGVSALRRPYKPYDRFSGDELAIRGLPDGCLSAAQQQKLRIVRVRYGDKIRSATRFY